MSARHAHRISALALLALLLGLAERAYAADSYLDLAAQPPSGTPQPVTRRHLPSVGPCACSNRVGATFSLPIWVPGVSGTLATGSQQTESSTDWLDDLKLIEDAATSLEFAFVGRVDLTWRRFSLLADGFGASIGSEIDWRGGVVGDTDTKLNATLIRCMLGYEVLRRTPRVGNCCSCLVLRAMAGVRWNSVHAEIEDESSTSKWTDAVVGFDLDWRLSPRWRVRVLGDLGAGLDSAAGNTQTVWSLGGELHYAFSRRFGMFVGYNVLRQRFERDGDSNDVDVDILLRGPVLGLSFTL